MSRSPLLRARAESGRGLDWIARADDPEWPAGLDFGLVRLAAGERFESERGSERAFVLLSGAVELAWDGAPASAVRDSLFDQRPTALHVDGATPVSIVAASGAELALIGTANESSFPARLFEPAGLLEEERRGEGRVDDAAFRLVRTIFDDRNRPEANLVLGEVVNLPGRWSSWPPHHHEQPELYHYRFDRPEGYGHAEHGRDVLRVESGDTLRIAAGHDHAQVAAPGCAMWYLWAIRHLPETRYTVPEFTDAHRWTMAPDASFWRPKREEA